MEDMLFGIQVLNYVEKFMFIDVPYYVYEIGHNSSLTKSISQTRMLQGFNASKIAVDYIKAKIMDESVSKKFLQFTSLMSYSLLRRIKFLKKEDKPAVINFLKNNKQILNYPYFFSTQIFYIVYKIFGLKFALLFI